MAAAIVISPIAWYFCKRRRTGDVHFSVLFQISLSESKRRRFYKNKSRLAKKCQFFRVFTCVYGVIMIIISVIACGVLIIITN